MKLRSLLICGALQLIAADFLRGAPTEIVVASYNLANYTVATGAGEIRPRVRPKSQESVEAVIQVIREIKPDILGVCEMGRPEHFEDFKARLKSAGLEYADSEYVQAVDPDRNLALLSRFPIISRQSLPDISFELNGQPEKVSRGFLDVTVRVNQTYNLRLVGVHLKSKLPVPQGDALIRRFEAQLLRKHLDTILSADPEANLLAYGDFNDSKNEPSIQEIVGVRGNDASMVDLVAADEHGDRWTYYWPAADDYSRIDYLFASSALLPEVIRKKSRVNRSPQWDKASDHRAIYTSIVPVNRKRR